MQQNTRTIGILLMMVSALIFSTAGLFTKGVEAGAWDVIFSGVELTGDLLALWMAIAIAVLMTIYRRYPNTPAAGPAALSSFLLLPLGYFLGVPFENMGWEILILALFGLVFALGSVTLGEGARRLPAGETALLSILEAPFAPILAWMVLNQVPTKLTVIGGFIILAGVVGSQLYSNRESSNNLTQTP